MDNNSNSNDYIATELLQELKRSSRRATILNYILVTVIVVIVWTFVWYLNQYDFTTEETHWASGTYAIVDSDGNYVAVELAEEKVEDLIDGNSRQQS